MHAVDDLGDAIDVTREFLTPVTAWRWFKLAVVVFFVGGFSGFSFPGGANPSGFEETQTEPAPAGETPSEVIESLDTEVLVLLAGVVALGLFLGVLFSLIGSIMEFVLIASLRSGEVHVRRYGKRHLGRALRLFGFRIGLGLLGVVFIGGPFALTFLGPGFEAVGLGALLALVGYAVVLSFVYVVIEKFTTEFVVPVMLQQERGILSAWRRFLSTLGRNKLEYLVYAILSVIVGLVLGIAVVVLGGIAFVALLIPFGIAFFILALLGPLGFVVMIPLGLTFLLVTILLFMVVQVPVTTYLRNYALLVLGDTDDALDLIPDQRRAARDGVVGGAGTGADRSRRDDWNSRWDDDETTTRDDGGETSGWTDSDESTGGDAGNDSGTGWDDSDESTGGGDDWGTGWDDSEESDSRDASGHNDRGDDGAQDDDRTDDEDDTYW